MENKQSDPRADKSIVDTGSEDRFNNTTGEENVIPVSLNDVPADEHLNDESIPAGQETNLSDEQDDNRDIRHIVGDPDKEIDHSDDAKN